MSNFSFILMAESIQVIFLSTFKTPLCCVLMVIELLVKSWKYQSFCKRCPETSTSTLFARSNCLLKVLDLLLFCGKQNN